MLMFQFDGSEQSYGTPFRKNDKKKLRRFLHETKILHRRFQNFLGESWRQNAYPRILDRIRSPCISVTPCAWHAQCPDCQVGRTCIHMQSSATDICRYSCSLQSAVMFQELHTCNFRSEKRSWSRMLTFFCTARQKSPRDEALSCTSLQASRVASSILLDAQRCWRPMAEWTDAFKALTSSVLILDRHGVQVLWQDKHIFCDLTPVVFILHRHCV